MEALRNIYHQSEKLCITGTVENAKNVYEQADCVVAPIFDGSGMKIKTGEALRYGKTIAGTPEAFAGYAITDGIEGYICQTAADFAETFKTIQEKQKTKINTASHLFFKSFLTKDNAKRKMDILINL